LKSLKKIRDKMNIFFLFLCYYSLLKKIMHLKLLAFGIAKDIFGTSLLAISTETTNTTVRELQQLLETRYPKLQQLSSYMIAVNNTYASLDDALSERDEIAIIPPVSGG
jgi:molybdopterin synthase sulfur carrier subunit